MLTAVDLEVECTEPAADPGRRGTGDPEDAILLLLGLDAAFLSGAAEPSVFAGEDL
jgi:hypothetical protein